MSFVVEPKLYLMYLYPFIHQSAVSDICYSFFLPPLQLTRISFSVRQLTGILSLPVKYNKFKNRADGTWLKEKL